MEINKQQISTVSNLKPDERYSYFIKRLADFEIFYTLKNDSNEFVISELEENKLIHFWSSPEFAQLCLVEVWENHKIVEVSLEEFEDEIVDFIEENSILIDIFPVENRTGFIVNLNEFVRDLNVEFGKY